MGGCQGKIMPAGGKKTLSQHNHDHGSQSTVVGDDHHHPSDERQKNPLGPDLTTDQPVAFGKPLREAYFTLDRAYHNLNHASYGTIPTAIQARLRHYQARHEQRPDHFIRYAYPALLQTNRAAAAALLNAPADDVVFVPNATTGVNTVLRGFPWSADGGDEILYFSTAYGACEKTIAYVRDATGGRVQGRRIPLTYPVSDAAVVQSLRDAITTTHARAPHHHDDDARGEGEKKTTTKRPRVALFDTVSSTPGVRVPFEALVATCRELGVLSLVDAAQGVGMLDDLDVAALDPDFLVTNCHKWLFVPRACAALYVAPRNQHLVRSTLPTSHSYAPACGSSADGRAGGDSSGVFPGSRSRSRSRSRGGSSDNKEVSRGGEETAPSRSGDGAGSFAEMFAYVGTLDNSPYLCVQDAIAWRRDVLGGEARIRAYCFGLAQDGGRRVAEALGTWVMQNEEGTLTRCSMVNVAMPLVVAAAAAPPEGEEGEEEEEEKTGTKETVIPYKDAQRVWDWMTKVLVEEYQTFIPVYYHAGRFWARLSAQVYLDMDDFEWAGKTLKELADRVARKEYDL